MHICAGCENLLLGFRIDVALVIGLYECQQLEKDITSGDVSIDSFSQYQPSFFFVLHWKNPNKHFSGSLSKL